MHNPSRYYARVVRILLVLAWVSAGARAEVRLPHVIGSHMVLQRDMELPIWGWADPGEQINVKIADKVASATAGPDGRWSARLPSLAAGGPHEMTVAGKNTLTLTDVLIGEVWLCSGQSNMEMGLKTVRDGAKEVESANYPQIRLFHLGRKTAASPQSDVEIDWRPCTPETVKVGGFMNGGFSAAAYFFGRRLHEELKVPIGLIESAWGGTRIEPWTPKEGFTQVGALSDVVKLIDSATPDHHAAIKGAVEGTRAWLPDAEKALAEGRPVPAPPAWPKHKLDDHTQPTGLYNAMIHPLVPFAIRGATWYQGESNAADGMAYRDKMAALIGGWRAVWGRGDFPFYYVQIAPFDAQGSLFQAYGGEQLPRLWEAQSAALAVANTGMVVTNDIGDLADIHPRNKQDVGTRLALWALAKTYGRDGLVYSGPTYKGMGVKGSRAWITFDHAAGGLAARDGKPLSWFTIAGEDRKFVPAQAEIDGDTVAVWSDAVSSPVAVRFAWSMTAEPNLMNKEGLPASAFRTDDWAPPTSADN